MKEKYNKIKEGEVKGKVEKYADSKGIKTIRNGTGALNGIPDSVWIYQGLTIWVEAKTEDGRLSIAQQHQMNEIVKHGGIWAIYYGVMEGLRLVDAIVERKKQNNLGFIIAHNWYNFDNLKQGKK